MAIITINPGDNVQQKIDASAAGDQIKFSAGRFILAGILLRTDRTYFSANCEATIAGSNAHALKAGVGGWILRDLKFEGPALQAFDSPWRDFKIESCEFTGANQTSRPTGVAEWASIAWTQKPTNGRITNCYIHDLALWTWIYGYGWDSLEIDHFTARRRVDPANPKTQGRVLKLHGAGANSNQFPEGAANETIGQVCKNLHVHDFQIDGYRGMGVEYQDGSDGDIWEDGVVINPIYFGSNPNDNLDVFGLSLVAARNRNCTIRRMLIRPNSPPSPGCFRVGLEIGGFNTSVTDCLFDGPMNASIANNGANASGLIDRNRFTSGAPAPENNRANRAAATITSNNAANTELSWNENRAFPGCSFANSQNTASQKFSAAVNVSDSLDPASGGGVVNISLSNVPPAAQQIKIDLRATRGVNDPRGLASQKFPISSELMFRDGPPGYLEDIRISALDAAENVLDAIDWFTLPKPFPGDSTSQWPKLIAPVPAVATMFLKKNYSPKIFEITISSTAIGASGIDIPLHTPSAMSATMVELTGILNQNAISLRGLIVSDENHVELRDLSPAEFHDGAPGAMLKIGSDKTLNLHLESSEPNQIARGLFKLELIEQLDR